jgi:hypothetical protein
MARAKGPHYNNSSMRFVGERKALAALILAFWAVMFTLNGLLGPPGFQAMFLCLGGVYLLAFFGLVAGYFWARWYALGLGLSGLAMGALMWWKIGLDPAVIIWGGGHGLVAAMLLGRGPASIFDGRKDWRDRYRMDENAANRLGKAIMRAGASLPYLIMAGLAPKQSFGGAVVGLAAVALGGAALVGMFRMRTWGLLAAAGAAILAGGAMGGDLAWFAPTAEQWMFVPGAGTVAGALLLLALLPFARPLIRFLRS